MSILKNIPRGLGEQPYCNITIQLGKGVVKVEYKQEFTFSDDSDVDDNLPAYIEIILERYFGIEAKHD